MVTEKTDLEYIKIYYPPHLYRSPNATDYHEIGSDRWEVRRVTVYPDGTREKLPRQGDPESWRELADVQFPRVEEFVTKDRYTVSSISAEEFAAEWDSD